MRTEITHTKNKITYNKLVSLRNGLTVDEACSQNRVTEKNVYPKYGRLI